jgi:hypothetical protein
VSLAYNSLYGLYMSLTVIVAGSLSTWIAWHDTITIIRHSRADESRCGMDMAYHAAHVPLFLSADNIAWLHKALKPLQGLYEVSQHL